MSNHGKSGDTSNAGASLAMLTTSRYKVLRDFRFLRVALFQPLFEEQFEQAADGTNSTDQDQIPSPYPPIRPRP